jgi:Flp pilus assembly protein TadG
MKSHFRLTNKGQALVEFIIIVPVFFFMMFFSFQVFKGIYQASVKQEQVRNQFLRGQVRNQANNAAMMQAGKQVERVFTNRVQTTGVPFLKNAGDSQEKLPVRIGICRTLEC